MTWCTLSARMDRRSDGRLQSWCQPGVHGGASRSGGRDRDVFANAVERAACRLAQSAVQLPRPTTFVSHPPPYY